MRKGLFQLTGPVHPGVDRDEVVVVVASVIRPGIQMWLQIG